MVMKVEPNIPPNTAKSQTLQTYKHSEMHIWAAMQAGVSLIKNISFVMYYPQNIPLKTAFASSIHAEVTVLSAPEAAGPIAGPASCSQSQNSSADEKPQFSRVPDTFPCTKRAFCTLQPEKQWAQRAFPRPERSQNPHPEHSPNKTRLCGGVQPGQV